MPSGRFHLKIPEALAVRLGWLGANKADLAPPSGGWLRTMRRAKGLALRAVAERLCLSAQAIDSLEKSERAGTISLASLRRCANALDCEVVLVLVPRASSIDEGFQADAENTSANDSP